MFSYPKNQGLDNIFIQEVPKHTRVPSPPKKVAKRAILPAHHPRVKEIIEPNHLKEGSIKIGEEVTEILEYNSAKLFVRRIVRPKYALKDQSGIIIVELPSLTLPKSKAGAGLLAHILVSKFVDHLPFYRQRQIFKRQLVICIHKNLNFNFFLSKYSRFFKSPTISSYNPHAVTKILQMIFQFPFVA